MANWSGADEEEADVALTAGSPPPPKAPGLFSGTPTEATANAGMPVMATSRMQLSSVGWLRTPTARQIASALERTAAENEVVPASVWGKLRSVNLAVLSPGQ